MAKLPYLSPRLLLCCAYFTTTAAAIIIGAGWGSTGTRSTAQGLSHLGISTAHCAYYVNNTLEEPKWCPLDLCEGYRVDLERALCEHREGAPISVFRIFDNLDAIFDAPIPFFFPYIFKAYPDAKVILTSRDSEAWYASRLKHRRVEAFPIYKMPLYSLLRGAFCRPDLSGERDIFAAKETVLLAYEAHLALVRDLVPPSQLLDIDVTSLPANVTWRRLAAFLGKEVPPQACLAEGCRFPRMEKGKGTWYMTHGNLMECSVCARRPSCLNRFASAFRNATAVLLDDDIE